MAPQMWQEAFSCKKILASFYVLTAKIHLDDTDPFNEAQVDLSSQG